MLHKLIKHSMLYTKKSEDELEQLEQIKKWRDESEKKAFLLLFDMLDVLVYEQANCYCKPKSTRIKSKNTEIPLLLSTFVRAFGNN